MTVPGLVVRPFREEDEAAVTDLWNEAFPAEPPRNDPARIVRRKLGVQRELFLVGELAGAIVATVLTGFDGHRAWIYHMAVRRSERRRGIGDAMMAEAESRLRAAGCPKINLQVLPANADVIAFYESLGYSVEERISMGKLLEEQTGGDGGATSR